MSYIKEENIGKISFATSVLLVVLLTMILGGVFLSDKYNAFDKKLAVVENIYIELKKEQLKSDVVIEIDRIDAFQHNHSHLSETLQKQQIIDLLNHPPADGIHKEYIFIYQIKDLAGGNDFATMLVNPNRPDLLNQSISDILTDAKGNMFRKQMLAGIRKNQEAYVRYWYKKPGQDGIFPKLSYFKFYPKWQWVVAKGSYVDDLDARVSQMQNQLKSEVRRTIVFLALFLFITCLLFLLLAFFFSHKLETLFKGYKNIQKKHRKKLETLNKRLKKKAATDPLTLLNNRAFFNARLEEEVSRARRYKSNLGLILFDIDYFKMVNDTYGHLEGDNVLRIISELCIRNIRTSDVLARWGGEEFVILVPESQPDDALKLADKLRIIVERYRFDRGFKITCSFGVTHLRNHEKSDDFINRADIALYQSKENGKNRVTTL